MAVFKHEMSESVRNLDVDNQVYDVPTAGEHVGILGFENSLRCIVALDGDLDGAWDVVGTYLVTGRLEAEMVTSALLGIDDGLDYGTAEALGRSHGNIDHGCISLEALVGIDEVLLELE